MINRKKLMARITASLAFFDELKIAHCVNFTLFDELKIAHCVNFTLFDELKITQCIE